MMQCFVDESGKGQKYFTVAGFLAAPAAWEAFTVEWKQELSQTPAISVLKTRELVRTEAGRERVKRFQAIIRAHVSCGFFTQVDTSYFKSIYPGTSSVSFDSPDFHIYWAFITAVIMQMISRKIPGPVDFIFDSLHSTTLVTLKQMTELLRHTPPIPSLRDWVGSDPISADEQDQIPLQSADLLAWSVWDAREGTAKIPTNETRGYRIFQDFNIPIFDVSFTDEELLAERDRMRMLQQQKGYEFETAAQRKKRKWKFQNPADTYYKNGTALTYSMLEKISEEVVDAANPKAPAEEKTFQLAVEILAYFLGVEWWNSYRQLSLIKFILQNPSQNPNIKPSFEQDTIDLGTMLFNLQEDADFAGMVANLQQGADLAEILANLQQGKIGAVLAEFAVRKRRWLEADESNQWVELGTFFTACSP